MKHRADVVMKSPQKSPQYLATPFKTRGVKWEIHNHDVDINNPSCPHMHAIGEPWKLDLYTGIIYNDNTGMIVGNIKQRDLIEIWKAKGVLKIIVAERAVYEELRKKHLKRYPELPPLLINPENTKNHLNRMQARKTTITFNRQNKIILQLKSKSPIGRVLTVNYGKKRSESEISERHYPFKKNYK